jgi:carbonic anhydrase/acetyltransferase-like protein (isoleucine patch superfamily)
MIYALGGVAPEIGPRVWVAPDANVVGAVTLDEDANVWFGATLRGDNERITIGARSNVQEGCVLHTDLGFPLTVGPDCTIGHKAILHGCTVEAGALIGMGATVLNGAVIGAGSLVGAGALVTEGKRIPPGSLVVGAPAKVVRPLDAAAQEALIASAAHYVANAARFRDGLKAV